MRIGFIGLGKMGAGMAAAKLFIVAAGPEESIARCQPVFAALG
jgi:3-hydroxyisobutyrate dehydrogenase-like beta-hydroxyacid dehydrogenase